MRQRGHIRDLGGGRFAITLSIPDGKGGRLRPRHIVRGTKKDAQAERTRLLRQLDIGEYIPPSDFTVSKFLDMWQEQHTATLAFRTRNEYRKKLEGYVIPEIGGLVIDKVQPLHIQRMFTTLRKRGLSERTLLQTFRILHRAFGHAVRWQLVNRNVMDSVDAPAPKRYQAETYTPEEVHKILDASGQRNIHTVIVIAIYTGLRRGEIAGLQWSDIDFENKKLHVNRSLYSERGQLKAKTPKSGKVRVLPIAGGLESELRRRLCTYEILKESQKDYNQTGWIVSKIDGNPLHPDWITHAFTEVLDQVGIPRRRLHDLRHSVASWMIEDGEPLKVVSEWLGHSTITITADLYGHVTQKRLETTADVLQKRLAK